MENDFVVSENLRRVGHQDDALFVEFRKGGCYKYHPVSYTMFDALRKSESPGKYLHRFIKSSTSIRHQRLETNPFTGEQIEVAHAA